MSFGHPPDAPVILRAPETVVSGSYIVTSTGDIQLSAPATVEASQANPQNAPSDANGSGGQNSGGVPTGPWGGRNPAPQRNRGGPGHQGGGDRPPTGQERVQRTQPRDLNTVRRMIQNGEFIIDAHVHSMEYTGRYYKNARRYSQWSLTFPEETPFGGFIDVYHDPAVWNHPADNKLDYPVAYVNRHYQHILQHSKRLGCAIACHPKFAQLKYARAVYGTEVVRAALKNAIENKLDFHGSPLLCIEEFGLEYGVVDAEKTGRFIDVSEAQKELFRMHVDIAKEYIFPIMLHIRGRDPEVQDKLERMAIELLQEQEFPQDRPIIRHTFCGSRAVAMEWQRAFPKTYFSYSKASMKWQTSRQCMAEFDLP
ncbi:hypothetical protein AAVH_17803 [Aphelenchoides avenae]|nr:hypothetical protein AAVH_17803 [Aphelenchus avenae]